MKTIILIETAEELIQFANPNRDEIERNNVPFLGGQAKLVFENDMNDVRLEGAIGFELSEKVQLQDILRTLLNKTYLGVHFT